VSEEIEVEPSELEQFAEAEATRDVEILLAMASPESHERAKELLAEERDLHYAELAKNYGDDGVPSADDFRLLDEIDQFATKVKQAIGYLASRGHGAELILWALRRHTDLLEGGEGEILSLVNVAACDADERTNGTRRKELKQSLVDAGAIVPTREIWKFLSAATKRGNGTSLEHPENAYELESAAQAAEYYGDVEEAEALGRRYSDMRERWVRDAASFTRLTGLGFCLSDENEVPRRDDHNGEVIRSREWRIRGRRRRIAVRRHFGRSRNRPG
jgi:hypothetical protein